MARQGSAQTYLVIATSPYANTHNVERPSRHLGLRSLEAMERRVNLAQRET
jgi:hypothetical protein